MTEKKSINLEIQGMTCPSCANHVVGAINKVSGVLEADIPGWESGVATVTLVNDVDPAELELAVKSEGYSAKVKTDNGYPRTTVPFISNGQTGDHIHLMVIGGGSAGFAAAIKGAELGYKVAMINDGTIGGTCVNIGCVPSKALIRATEHYHTAGKHPFRGVQTMPGALNWAQVVAQKDELVDELRQAKYSDVLAGYPSVAYIEGRAHLTGGNGVEIDGETYTPDKIILATGASPWAPPIPGLRESSYLTSTTAMELTELPRSMIVLGANAVGLELAQTFARAGVLVTVLELLERISPFEDEDISAAMQELLEEDGLRVVTGFQTQKVERRDERYTLTGTLDGEEITFAAEQLLVATGRRPNTHGMGLEGAGVQLGQRGEVIVDETLQTTNPDIYAAGDITGHDMFVYVAAYAGGLAAENALTGSTHAKETSYIARVTFTDPQIASAGLTEAQAREQGYAVKTSNLPMAYVPRALAARDTRGLIKLVTDAATDKLLGAHILAPEAGEIIQTAALALKLGLTVEDLRTTIFPYLTNVEGLKLATLAFEKDVAMLSCCAG
jgi:mercuric reductase